MTAKKRHRPSTMVTFSTFIDRQLIVRDLIGAVLTTLALQIIIFRWWLPEDPKPEPQIAELTAEVMLLRSRFDEFPTVKEAAADALTIASDLRAKKLDARVTALEKADASSKTARE